MRLISKCNRGSWLEGVLFALFLPIGLWRLRRNAAPWKKFRNRETLLKRRRTRVLF